MYAYYMFSQFGWTPSQFMSLPTHERRLIMTFIDQKITDEKEAVERAKSGGA